MLLKKNFTMCGRFVFGLYCLIALYQDIQKKHTM